MIDLTNLKEGDHVWCGRNEHLRSGGVHKVHRVTKTQIVLDWHGDRSWLPRYNRSGYPLGGSLFAHHITGIASTEEGARWNSQQAKKAEAAAQLKAEEAKRMAKQRRLEATLPDRCSVDIKDDNATVLLFGVPVNKVAAILRAAKAVLNPLILREPDEEL